MWRQGLEWLPGLRRTFIGYCKYFFASHHYSVQSRPYFSLKSLITQHGLVLGGLRRAFESTYTSCDVQQKCHSSGMSLFHYRIFIKLTIMKPRCPMHTATPSNTSSPPQHSFPSTQNNSCPIMAPDAPLTSTDKPLSPLSKLNPLNFMPSSISQSRARSQKIILPLDRTVSSIPRGDDEGNWVYPSPQQMYNAMLRKGYDDTPEDAVESMVAVHNFLNEGAWEEIEGWERRFSQGLSYGWETCRMGEEGYLRSGSMAKGEEQPRPRLLRFHGRPTTVSPKARIYDFLGRVYPTKFAYVLLPSRVFPGH